MNDLYLSLGSNQGDRTLNLQQAAQNIDRLIGKIAKISSYYETEPWGFSNNSNFINQVLKVQSKLSANVILAEALEIERRLGRKRLNSEQGYSNRPIDIDILFIDSIIIDTKDLKIPHIHAHKRNFVLKPMCEIEPFFVHPVLNKTISQLAEECTDKMKAIKI